MAEGSGTGVRVVEAHVPWSAKLKALVPPMLRPKSVVSQPPATAKQVYRSAPLVEVATIAHTLNAPEALVEIIAVRVSLGSLEENESMPSVNENARTLAQVP
jgi:hypothetical protein